MTIAGGSSERFGYQWGRYRALPDITREQFLRWSTLVRSWSGKTFLDVGCGMGRNSYWAARLGASGGSAIDVDERTVSAARQTLQGLPVEVASCSAYDIPWRDAFDIVFSIGVIHHLEFPQRALANMVQAAKPGGTVAIWVYGHEGNRRLLWVLQPVRAVTSRLPMRIVAALSYVPAALLWSIVRLKAPRSAYFRLLGAMSFTHIRVIVQDQLLPRIAHYWRRNDVLLLMAEAGLSDIQITHVNGNSWAAVGTKLRERRG